VGPSAPPPTPPDTSRGIKILFGGVEGTGVDATDPAAVAVTVPDAAPIGPTEVSAVIAAGVKTASSLPFQVSVGPAQILAVRPVKIVLGTDTELALDGLGFGDTAGSLLLDGRPLNVTTWSPRHLVAELPASPVGVVAGAPILRVVDSMGRPTSDFPVEVA
jgi:hypothetical protein